MAAKTSKCHLLYVQKRLDGPMDAKVAGETLQGTQSSCEIQITDLSRKILVDMLLHDAPLSGAAGQPEVGPYCKLIDTPD